MKLNAKNAFGGIILAAFMAAAAAAQNYLSSRASTQKTTFR
jgi:hypothetical protein